MATLYYAPHNGMIKGRKRRLSEDEDMSDATHSPSSPSRRSSRDAGKMVEVKRYKSGVQKRSPTTALLATLDKEKLIQIVHSLFDAHPELRQDIMTYIPTPTVASAATVLQNLEKRLADSFPYNRLGPSRNDYTFSRVRGPLTELVDTIVQYTNHFTSPLMFPTTSFAFLDVAASFTHRLPDWENEENNQLKRDLYHELNGYWKRVIQSSASKLREGEMYSPQTVSEWAKSLAQHNSQSGGLFTEAVHEFSRRLGFMIGLAHNDMPRDVPICHHPAVENDIARLSSPPRVVGYADARR